MVGAALNNNRYLIQLYIILARWNYDTYNAYADNS